MQCSRCGGNNLESAEYCQACSAPLRVSCTDCGHVALLGTGDVCQQCHAPLAAAKSGAISQRLFKSLSASGGERKRLTVLFADVKNSTTLIDQDDPEVAMQRLHPALEC